jgi:hypothetical protein
MLDFYDENTYEPLDDLEYFDELMDEFDEDRYPIGWDDEPYDDYEEEEFDPGWWEDFYD